MTTLTERMRALLTAPEIETLDFWSNPDILARVTEPGTAPDGGFLVVKYHEATELRLVTAERRIFIRVADMLDPEARMQWFSDGLEYENAYSIARSRVVSDNFCSHLESHFAACRHPLHDWYSTVSFNGWRARWFIANMLDGPYSFYEGRNPHYDFLSPYAARHRLPPPAWESLSASERLTRLDYAIETCVIRDRRRGQGLYDKGMGTVRGDSIRQEHLKYMKAGDFPCCAKVKPRSLICHYRSIRHIANVYGTPYDFLRRRLYEIRVCLLPMHAYPGSEDGVWNGIEYLIRLSINDQLDIIESRFNFVIPPSELRDKIQHLTR